MSDDQHKNSGAESHLRSSQSSHGNKGGIKLGLLEGRNGDAMLALIQGHGNILAESGATSSSSSSGSGESMGSHDMGSKGGISINTASSDSKSMVELVGGKPDRNDDDRGGWSR